MKRVFLLAIIGLAALLLSRVLTYQISPRVMTKNRFSSLESRIQAYASQHQTTPPHLSDLPARPGYDNSLQDGWGKEIFYSHESDGSVVLTSTSGGDSDNFLSIQFSIIPKTDQASMRAKDSTFANMWRIEEELRRYVASHHDLPAALSFLPDDVRSKEFDVSVDGWGTPIEFELQRNGLVALVSRGRPGSKQIFSIVFAILVRERRA